MGIVLTATVPNNGVFYAGELFSCTITFTNQKDESKKPQPIPEKPKAKRTSMLPASPIVRPSIDTLRSFAGNMFSVFSATTPALPTSALQTPATTESFPTDQLDLASTVRGMVKTKSMSSEFAPRVETVQTGKPIEPIAEEKSDSFSPNQEEMVSESGGKVNLSSTGKIHRPSNAETEEAGSDDDVEQKFVQNERPAKPGLTITTMMPPDVSKSTVAWSFAQLTGHFVIDSNYVKSEPFQFLLDKVMYSAPGSRNVAGGGGSLSTSNDNIKQIMYEILLPFVLPPSHKGKVIRFQYKLSIGIQKTPQSGITQIVSIPFRMFNRTNTDGTKVEFEVLKPVINIKDDAKVTVVQSPTRFDMDSRVLSPIFTTMDSWASLHSSQSKIELEVPTTSYENVTTAIQHSAKVSYDICKNNEHVAQLILPRLSYRLGESVVAVLDFSKSAIPVFNVSAYLECHEQVEPMFSVKPKQQVVNHTRLCFGEFHQNTLNAKRTVISLSISPKGTPDYTCTATSIHWSLRVEFITGLNSKIFYETYVLEGFNHERALPRVNVEPFECIIPLRVFGALKCPSTQDRKLEFAVQ